MPAVRRCEDAQRIEQIRLGEERRLASGTVRRYVTCEGGRPLLVQLPTCYAPAGLLSDFDEGARLALVPVDAPGRGEVLRLLGLCRRILEGVGGAPAVQIDEDTGELSAAAARARDVRVFEAEDLAADDCPVLPGDTVTAIVSPDYYWRSASGGRHGLSIRLVQVLLHTDRGRYRDWLLAGPAPDPPPRAPRPPPPPLPRPPPPPRPPVKRKENPAESRQRGGGFRPSVMEIVTARTALRKTPRGEGR